MAHGTPINQYQGGSTILLSYGTTRHMRARTSCGKLGESIFYFLFSLSVFHIKLETHNQDKYGDDKFVHSASTGSVLS
ncbi:hypothetical protein M8J75_005468 [Diaphorina citri]|nr:hypothetical protein M8J75_005468 [Diaphorina citri]